MTDLLKEQEEFVDWLRSKGMYKPMEASHIMQMMFTVWKTLKEEMEAK